MNIVSKSPKEARKRYNKLWVTYFYELVVEDSPEEYCVVADKETDTNAILRNSVMSKQRRNYDNYLMKDKIPLKQPVEQGAIRVEKLEGDREDLEWKTNGS